jgi:hypothetical protein
MNTIINKIKNQLPKYTIEQPSTRKKVTFRPFTVKEEKNLQIANQTGSYEDFLVTLSDVINNCFGIDVDSKSFPIFDIEYFFINLRAKSIGELIEPTIICPETKENIKIKINLEEIKPVYDLSHKNKIDIGSNILVTMKHPSLDYILNNSDVDYYDMLIDCIVSIETIDEIFNSVDVSRDTIKEFVESLTSKQFKNLIDFFKTMPKIEKEINYKTSDGIERKITLKGLRDFFQSASAT